MVREKCLMAPSPHIQMLVMQVDRTCRWPKESGHLWAPPPPPPSHPQVTGAAPTQAGKPPATSQLWLEERWKPLSSAWEEKSKGRVIRVPQIRAALPPLTAVWNSIQAENQRGRWGKGAFDTAVMDTAAQWHLFFTLWVLLKAEPLDDGLEQRKRLNYP